MKRKTFSLGGVALRCLVLALCILPTAGAAELTPRQLKKNLKEAEKAWSAGRTAAAVELYEGILDATEPGAPERADALYAVGLASLADNKERAGQLLAELAEKSPRHPSSGTAKAIVALLSELDGARAESARLTAELEASQASATELAELREKLAQAESQLSAVQDAREQLARKDKEIADCEQKLKKVRETLVGGGGPS